VLAPPFLLQTPDLHLPQPSHSRALVVSCLAPVTAWAGARRQARPHQHILNYLMPHLLPRQRTYHPTTTTTTLTLLTPGAALSASALHHCFRYLTLAHARVFFPCCGCSLLPVRFAVTSFSVFPRARQALPTNLGSFHSQFPSRLSFSEISPSIVGLHQQA
jgi:hypothetical protein